MPKHAPTDFESDAPTDVLEDAPKAHTGINKGNKQPSKDSTSSSCLAPTMPPLDILVPNLAPTVPSPEPVDSPVPNCFEDDEQDEDDFVWIWPGKKNEDEDDRIALRTQA